MKKKIHWKPFSHKTTSDEDTKLITFRVPNSIVNDFDELVKFKRGSRTSYLVGFMDNFIRNEFKRLEESNRVNEFIHSIRSRNKTTENLPKSSDNVWKTHRDDYYEPINIPHIEDDWENDLMRL